MLYWQLIESLVVEQILAEQASRRTVVQAIQVDQVPLKRMLQVKVEAAIPPEAALQ